MPLQENQPQVAPVDVATPDLTDMAVMVPRARRYIEGPYGPAYGRSPLEDTQIYDMVADACSDIILLAGSLFGHMLIVTARDPTAGFPIKWSTDTVLEEWEVAAVTTQVALNYYFFLFRDLKSQESIKNEGTEWSYSLGVGVIRGYLDDLRAERDAALKALRSWHWVADRYASNIRIRDQQTVALLEWWASNIADRVPGLPGGQEAAVIPWTPGWSGPGFTP